MRTKSRSDRAWLLTTAKAIAERLKLHREGTRLRIRVPGRVYSTRTRGWSASIGDIGKNQPRIEIWLDRFSGYPGRKFYACFVSYKSRPPIIAITKRVSRALWPIRTVTLKEVNEEKYFSLVDRLGRSEFNLPILEKYLDGQTFYGFYDPTQGTAEKASSHFCERALSFFIDVARALPHAAPDDGAREVYPQQENRKRVASHLRRERSGLLASECKIRDNFRCQVCGLRFDAVYGKLGEDFAEAHHRVPLSQLRENIKTRLEDLATVCANCHRMLHKMAGKRGDVEGLRKIICGHRPERS